jgi:hypothetical protein
MDEKKLLAVIDADPPRIGEITPEVRKRAVEYSSHYRGSVRLALGRFWTDKEYDEYRKAVLAKRLP